MPFRQNLHPPRIACWHPEYACALLVIVAFAGCSREASEVDTAAVPAKRATPPEFDRSHPVVLIHTNVGDIKLKLDADQAPGTVHNFLGYVTDGFYNGTTFHYVESGAMIVGGGYTPKGDRKKTNLPIRNEAHNGLKNERGTVAMARDTQVIDSATSQFFINLVPAPGWNHKGDSPAEYGYCVFGEVTDGLDVADKISKMPTKDLGGDLSNSPQPTVVIESIKLIQ